MRRSRLLGLLGLLLSCEAVGVTAEFVGAANETVEAGADATTGGNATAAHGQLTEILDADESAIVRSDVNGTGRGTGQSAATVTGEGYYIGGDDKKSGMGSLAVEAVGDDTQSSGQNTVAIEKVADGNGSFDLTHHLESLSIGQAKGKGISSVQGQHVLDFQSVSNGTVKKAVSVGGKSNGVGSVNNQNGGISSLDVLGAAVDGPDAQGDGTLSTETSAGPHTQAWEAVNETMEAGADAITSGNETEILDADESAFARSGVNPTGRDVGQSAATVTGGRDDEKSAMGSLAAEAAGNATESSGQNTVAIETVADGNGGLDWTHYLESLPNGLAQAKGQSSVQGQKVLDFQSVIKFAVQKAISVDGNTQGVGDGDIFPIGQTHFHGKITEDSTKLVAEGAGDALGKLSAAANGGANPTADEGGNVKELNGMNPLDNSTAVTNAQVRVDLEDGVTETNGVGSVNPVLNEDDGISSLDVRGTSVDLADVQGDGSLSAETSGGPGSVVVDGSARATTYNVDCDSKKNKDHACCKDPASDECKPKPGASGSVDKVVSIVGTDQMFKSSDTLDMKAPEGDTLMSSTNIINATGNIDTTANGSLSITMDKEGNNETLTNTWEEAEANSEEARRRTNRIDISSPTGMHLEPRGRGRNICPLPNHCPCQRPCPHPLEIHSRRRRCACERECQLPCNPGIDGCGWPEPVPEPDDGLELSVHGKTSSWLGVVETALPRDPDAFMSASNGRTESHTLSLRRKRSDGRRTKRVRRMLVDGQTCCDMDGCVNT